MMLDADGACLSPNSKPHICEHCNAAFRSSYHLRRHVLIHTGERLSLPSSFLFIHFFKQMFKFRVKSLYLIFFFFLRLDGLKIKFSCKKMIEYNPNYPTLYVVLFGKLLKSKHLYDWILFGGNDN